MGTGITPRVFECRVEEVHSGDDLVAMIDLGISGLYKKARLRLHKVDAPNAWRAGANTDAGRVRDLVKRLVNGRCVITVISEGRGGLVVEMLVDRQGEVINLNQLLQEQGYIYVDDKSSPNQSVEK